MNKNTTIILIIIIALAVLGLIYFKSSPNELRSDNINVVVNPEQIPNNLNQPESSQPVTNTTTTTITTPTPVTISQTKSFTISGKNFSYNPRNISVKRGDTVKITFVNNDGLHDLRIDEFAASTSKIKSGQNETITFVADKTGTFEYYCSVGDHRAAGMVGTLIVSN